MRTSNQKAGTWQPDEKRVLDNYPGYCVSARGRVFSCHMGGEWVEMVARIRRRANGKPHLWVNLVDPTKPKFRNQRRRSRSRAVRVDKLVAEAFLGPKPLGHCIKHKDGHKWNCAADNLIYIPRAEIKSLSGSNHPNAMLTEEKVIRLRRGVHAGDVDWARWAADLGVSVYTCKLAARGVSWGRVDAGPRGPLWTPGPRRPPRHVKATEAEVSAVKARLGVGESPLLILKSFPNLTIHIIESIQRGKSWRHVQ